MSTYISSLQKPKSFVADHWITEMFERHVHQLFGKKGMIWKQWDGKAALVCLRVQMQICARFLPMNYVVLPWRMKLALIQDRKNMPVHAGLRQKQVICEVIDNKCSFHLIRAFLVLQLELRCCPCDQGLLLPLTQSRWKPLQSHGNYARMYFPGTRNARPRKLGNGLRFRNEENCTIPVLCTRQTTRAKRE